MALEFAAKGGPVNADCAAIIETNMTQQISGDNQTRSYLVERHAIGRFVQPEEIAAAVLCLLRFRSVFLETDNLEHADNRFRSSAVYDELSIGSWSASND